MSDVKQPELRSPVDLEAVPSHVIGTAVLDASDGSLVRPCSGKMTKEVRY